MARSRTRAYLAAYAIRAVRWRIMILPMAPQASVWQLVISTFIGFTAVVLFGSRGRTRQGPTSSGAN